MVNFKSSAVIHEQEIDIQKGVYNDAPMQHVLYNLCRGLR